MMNRKIRSEASLLKKDLERDYSPPQIGSASS